MAFAINNEVHIFFLYVFLSGGNYFPIQKPNSKTIRFPLLVMKKQKASNLNNMRHIRKEQNLTETCSSTDSIKERRCLCYGNIKKKNKLQACLCKITLPFKNRENKNYKLKKTKDLATLLQHILFLYTQPETKGHSCFKKKRKKTSPVHIKKNYKYEKTQKPLR